MNPDANNFQDQTTDANDPIMDNKYIVEAAQQILADEQAQPGSQDPAAVEWAKEKVNLPVPGDPGTATAIQTAPDTLQVQHGPDDQVPVPPQGVITPQAPESGVASPDASQEAASPEGHTLYIDRSEPQQPNQGDQPNGSQGQPQ